jgi:hypothetical protein
MRSYSVTYVNFKVLYIGRESDVIVTCFVAGFVSCVALRVECGVQSFYSKDLHPLLWVELGVVSGKITSGVRRRLRYCGLCPRVADSCRKQSCTLNRSLGTLQLPRAALIVNVVSVAVL